MEVETPQHSTQMKYSMKTGNWLQDPHLILARVKNGFTKENAQDVAVCLLEWSAQDDAWSFNQFCELIGLPRNTFETRVRKFDILKNAHTVAKDRIAERRERKATFKKYDVDPGMVRPTLHHYDYDWRKDFEETIKREDKKRKEDRDHQIEMLKLKAAQAEGALNRLEEWFKENSIALPELNVKKVNVSSRDSKRTPKV